ncbi:MAG: hypothetical protein H0W43_07725 [Chthoniobacterales bacterium]|nr:hypothetical protein [Chthoniobacterales bacterium]
MASRIRPLADLVVGDAVGVPGAKGAAGKEDVLSVVEVNDGITPAGVFHVTAREIDLDVAPGDAADAAINETGGDGGSGDGGGRLVVIDLAVLDGEDVEAGAIVIRRDE